VLFLDNNTKTGNDVLVLSPDGKLSTIAATPFGESSANVSADGRYVAYVSDESGRNDVYAVPISGQDDHIMVSVDGGTGPVWSRDGRELFYRAGDDLMSVQVRSTAPWCWASGAGCWTCRRSNRCTSTISMCRPMASASCSAPPSPMRARRAST
jgi:hypothetical protein